MVKRVKHFIGFALIQYLIGNSAFLVGRRKLRIQIEKLGIALSEIGGKILIDFILTLFNEVIYVGHKK